MIIHKRCPCKAIHTKSFIILNRKSQNELYKIKNQAFEGTSWFLGGESGAGVGRMTIYDKKVRYKLITKKAVNPEKC